MESLVTALAHLHFLRPLWLLALPAVPLLAWWWWRTRLRETVWRQYVDAHLLRHLLATGDARARRGGLWGSLALLLALVALAGPTWRQGEQPLWRSRAPLVVALDLSSATLAADLPPSRLLQARAKLAMLLREREGGQVGLVVFAGDAFTVAPLTEDTGNIALFLDALAPDLMPVDGQRADRAIAWSTQLLRQAGFERGGILLLTDHADADARHAAEAASRAGFEVSVLGLGTPKGAAHRNAEGAIVHARLDADALASLARSGGGRYAPMTAGDGDLRALGLLSGQDMEGATSGESARSWRDEGYWLLPPLMLLALLAFRRGAIVATLALATLLPSFAHAQEGTLWRRGDQVAHARMQAGEQAYRAGDYARAAQAYAGADNADAHYNRGNAFARQGAYAQAIAEYDRALRRQPGMADAIANRRAVEAAMKRKPPQGQGQSQPKQGGQQQPSPSQSAAGQQGAQRQDARDPAEAPQRQPPPDAKQSGNTGTPQPQPPRNSDAAAQRAADAAQRERMRRALQARKNQQGARDGAQATTRAETPAERERRLANEAWLRRVPDDPGGLLRAKFRLEYERHQQGGNE